MSGVTSQARAGLGRLTTGLDHGLSFVANTLIGISAIVLSRPDPDHAAGAEALAIPRRVPILVAPGAGRYLPSDVVEVRDGEELPSDLRPRVRLDGPGSGRLEVVAPWADPPLSAG